jgi:hypothetical protein
VPGPAPAARGGWELDVLCVPDKSAELDGRCRSGAGHASTVADMDWKIELVAIPVTDVDRVGRILAH